MKLPTPITITTPRGRRRIGPGQPVFIVAEMSANHHHRYTEAVRLIDVAAKAGVDAIKIQTYTPDTMTIDSDKYYFHVKVNRAWRGKTLYQLYKEAYTPWDWQPRLKRYAESKGLVFFSTPFDETAVTFLQRMRVPLYKVASFEIVDIPLLRVIGATKKPVIISRGMASEAEISLAIATLRRAGCPAIAVLHCVSSYPAKPAEMNLTTIPAISRRFKVVAGLSNHCLDESVDVAAVTLGAAIIEKHFTLSRSTSGPDTDFSLEPHELRHLVTTIRQTEQALGKSTFTLGAGEKENKIFRRSLFVVADIAAGEKFTAKNIRSIRPGFGLAPRYLEKVIGRRATRSISRGTPLSWKLIKR